MYQQVKDTVSPGMTVNFTDASGSMQMAVVEEVPRVRTTGQNPLIFPVKEIGRVLGIGQTDTLGSCQDSAPAPGKLPS